MPAVHALEVNGGYGMSTFTLIPAELDAVQIIERQDIKVGNGTLHAHQGDWLITRNNGEKHLICDIVFRQIYRATGQDKCTFCEYGTQEKRPCYSYETCVFKWKVAGEGK
jgi:hypothetical protein